MFLPTVLGTDISYCYWNILEVSVSNELNLLEVMNEQQPSIFHYRVERSISLGNSLCQEDCLKM